MRQRCAYSLIAPMPKRTAVDRRARALRLKSTASGPESAHPPTWIKPQLTRLAEEAPEGTDWLHEIKYDGYRMHARIDGDKIQLLTRTGLDWSHRYKRTIEALRSLRVRSAYLDGELCALNADGVPVFSRLQAAMDEGRTDQLVFLAFDLLFLNGQSTAQLPLIERKERLKRLFKKDIQGLRYNEHVTGDGPRFREHACKLGLEGVISKRADRPYAPGDRGIWVKSKCLNREEFVVVGWTDPEGSRRHIGALLLGYYTEDGRLHYAGRAGTGMNDRELKRLAGVLAPLQAPKMPLAAPPPRDNRFGSPLKLSKVHWVRPVVVVEVTYLTWTEGGLLRAVSYQGQREDKTARRSCDLLRFLRGRSLDEWQARGVR
jgi:bifunctional non-homologous end joining protein LigD